jgi:hypothetical protein
MSVVTIRVGPAICAAWLMLLPPSSAPGQEPQAGRSKAGGGHVHAPGHAHGDHEHAPIPAAYANAHLPVEAGPTRS